MSSHPEAADPVDHVLKTPSGSSVWHWKDILAEHEKLRDDSRFGSSVFLIMSNKFGAAIKSPNGKPYYVTAVDNSFYRRRGRAVLVRPDVQRPAHGTTRWTRARRLR